MPNNESEYFDKINATTAERRKQAEQEARRKAAMEQIRCFHIELCREKAQDRIYMGVAFAMMGFAVFCAKRIDIIPDWLAITAYIPLSVCAVSSVISAIKLGKRICRMAGECK